MPPSARRGRDSENARVNNLLRILVEGTSGAVGRDFFASLATHLAAALNVRCAFAAELIDAERLRLLALCVDGESRPPFEHAVVGTPCAVALERGRFAVRSGLSKRYPRCDELLGTQAHSYIGVRLETAAGEPLGVLGVLDSRPLRADGAAAAIIGIFAARASAEIERLRAEQARRQSEERLRAVVRNAPLLLTAIDRDGVFRLVDGRLAERAGVDPSALTGKSFRDVLQDRPESVRDVERAFAGEAVTSVERFRDLFLEARYVPVRGADGDIAGVIGVALDVTEREQAFRSLQASEARLRAVVSNAPIVLFAVDRQGRFTLSEGKGLKALGLRGGEVVGRSAFDMYSAYPAVVANLRRALAGKAVTDTVAVNGLYFETHYLPIRNSGGEVEEVIGVATDVTERMRALEALREQARRDPLTGVLNHASITDTLRERIAAAPAGERLAVILADVDGMKAANDTYGHHVGDAVLRTVSEALCEEGAIVGRYGGDEFIVLLPGAGRAEAERYRATVAERLRDANVTDQDSGAVLPVTVAVGIAVYPDEAETAEDLLRLADSAMYVAKRQRTIGRGTAAKRWPLPADRAAKVVGEIVPLLTSPGRLEDKLRLVSHRLSVGIGYDAVNFALVGRPASPTVAANTFARAPQDLVEEWNRTQRENTQLHPVRELLERTRRPIVFDDPQNDERIIPEQRALLKAAKLRSAIAVPMLWENQLIGILAVASKRKRAFGPRDAQFLLAVATQVTAIVRMATLVEQLQSASARLEQSQADTVLMLAAAAEARDRVTGLHLQNIRALTEALALELGYPEEDARTLGLAAVLHDIGKIRVPDAVLSGSGPLTDEDWELMKQHTVWGAELFSGHPGFELATVVARHHHERWDGSGYPDGLAGEEIPEAACIVAVADAFDAMTSDRPYRAALTTEEAMAEIAACSGRQFSPRVAEAMLRLYRRRALPTLRRHARAA